MEREKNPLEIRLYPAEKNRRKPYHSPRLEDLGDVRSVTLGATTFTDDESGDPGGPYLPRP